LGLKVTGKLDPERVNPVPVTAAALTVTAKVPVEDRVTDCVAGVFNETLPKDNVLELMLNVGTPAPSCNEKVFDVPPALAVNVTACGVVNDEIVAVKFALAALTGTVTDAGTAT